jgi:hypothetical protein
MFNIPWYQGPVDNYIFFLIAPSCRVSAIFILFLFSVFSRNEKPDFKQLFKFQVVSEIFIFRFYFHFVFYMSENCFFFSFIFFSYVTIHHAASKKQKSNHLPSKSKCSFCTRHLHHDVLSTFSGTLCHQAC